MSNILAALQMMNGVSEENTIEKTRIVLNEIVNWFKNSEKYTHYCEIFADSVRNLDVKTLTDADGFFVDPHMFLTELPEEFRHDVYGLCYNDNIRFAGRFVYPVKDPKGNVMGFCGYDKFSDVKYLDSLSYGYVAKQYSVWGMERLEEAYTTTKTVYFVEGIVCALYLRQCGELAFATLGSNFSNYAVEIINRIGSRAVYIADSDAAGTSCKKRLIKYAPLCRVVQSTLAKDVDDSRKINSDFILELRKLHNPFYVSKLFR